jgi:hypothetical protein
LTYNRIHHSSHLKLHCFKFQVPAPIAQEPFILGLDNVIALVYRKIISPTSQDVP